jgi:uncharacterized C2H2 Zn-finger protein
MSQKKYPENEPSNERSSQSETKGRQSSGQNPMPTGPSQQNKCEVCGQTFSHQNELNDHYKTVHKMEAPAQKSQSEGGSSSSGSRWSGQGTENQRDKATKEEAGSINKGNETSSTQSGERDVGSQKQMQNSYKCQRCYQVLSSQNDLNEHNKNVHGIEPAEMGKEREAKKQ